MSEPVIAVLAVLGFAVVFPAFWLAVVWLVGRVGWRSLAERFPADRWPEQGEGVAVGMQTGSVGLANYRSSLNAVLTLDGLFLRPVWLFSFGHPPVFVPWAAVERVEKVLFGGVRVFLSTGDRLVLHGRLARLVRESFGVD